MLGVSLVSIFQRIFHTYLYLKTALPGQAGEAWFVYSDKALIFLLYGGVGQKE